MKTILIATLAIFIISCLVMFIFWDSLLPNLFLPRKIVIPNKAKVEIKKATIQDVEVVAQNLSIPWEIVFLPNKDMLVTERPGQLIKIQSGTKVIAQIAGVKHIGEGGLLGMAIHPNFSSNNYLYLYLTTQDSSGVSNRVERYRLVGDVLTDRRIILEGIRGSVNHDGGRIKFGPDGYLYITTGDAENRPLVQDKNSLNGKILRIKDDGSIPQDNPFGNAVYSLGHRNPQSLAWDKNGQLWETEHGPSGTETGYDEVNIIRKGGNYGWPVIKGDQTHVEMISPVIQSGGSDTWAPAGMTYWEGRLFFSGLRGESLYEGTISSDNRITLRTHLEQKYGRLRAVVLGPDGFLYVSTSNTDGRGKAKENDDKILKIDPRMLR